MTNNFFFKQLYGPAYFWNLQQEPSIIFSDQFFYDSLSIYFLTHYSKYMLTHEFNGLLMGETKVTLYFVAYLTNILKVQLKFSHID